MALAGHTPPTCLSKGISSLLGSSCLALCGMPRDPCSLAERPAVFGRQARSYRRQIIFINALALFIEVCFYLSFICLPVLLVGNGKRFIAYEIIKRLEAANHSKILLQLKEGIMERDVNKPLWTGSP